MVLYDYDVRDFSPLEPKLAHNNDGSVRLEEIPTYILEEKDLSLLEDIFRSASYREITQNIKLACSRYDDSYNTKSRKDKFIDLAICIEALFSRDEDIEGTLGHKFSLRLSRFIDIEISNRADVYRNMKELYGQRSGIVHAKDVKELDLDTLKDYVRKSLTIYLKKLKNNPNLTHTQIIDEIDYA